MKSLAESALGYVRKGLAVFPCEPKGKRPVTEHGLKDATTDEERVREWWQQHPDANIGHPTGQLVVLDIDGPEGEAALKNLESVYGRLPPTLEARSGIGRHFYFTRNGHAIRNSAGKLGPHLDVRGEGGYVILPPSIHENGKEYEWVNRAKPAEIPDWLVALLAGRTEGDSERTDEKIREGQRNSQLASLAGTMRRRGMSRLAIEKALLEENRLRCEPPLPDDEVRAIAASIGRYPAGAPRVETSNDRDWQTSPAGTGPQHPDESTPKPEFQTRWPDPPDEKAFHGPAGDFVRALEPYSEADPVALLTQTLIGFGNLIGRGPHFRVEDDRHFTNENIVLIGETSKGRKGTSAGRVRSGLSEVDPEWERNRIQGGLSSGEGLIWAVRDKIMKRDPIRVNRRVVDYEWVEADPGVSDKRLLAYEPEFASVLRQLERDGNILSTVIRHGFDTGSLRTMTKNSPAVATDAHISIVGHITVEELRRYLSATEQGNGFANRFMWNCVRRSKYLPEGGDWAACQRELVPVIEKFRSAAAFARTVGEMVRDETAREYWRAIYRDLSSGRPGLLGAVTSRAEAHVVRLSCLYALLDQSAVIKGEHVEAAVALWEYAEASCRYIFGDATGNPDADVILKALRNAPGGLTRTQISGLFGRNKPTAMIGRALDSLLAMGLIRFDRRDTDGRSAEVSFAV